MVSAQVRMGGAAAIAMALCYAAGFAIFATQLPAIAAAGPSGSQGWLSAIGAAALPLGAAYVLTYIVCGIALAALVVGLHARIAPLSPALGGLASAIGLIWSGLVVASGLIAVSAISTSTAMQADDPATAAVLMRVMGTIANALGGGSEVIGGVWSLIVSAAAWRHRALPRALNLLGFAIGAIGVATIAPALSDLVEIFGLSQILWFLWCGIVLLRDRPMPG